MIACLSLAGMLPGSLLVLSLRDSLSLGETALQGDSVPGS